MGLLSGCKTQSKFGIKKKRTPTIQYDVSKNGLIVGFVKKDKRKSYGSQWSAVVDGCVIATDLRTAEDAALAIGDKLHKTKSSTNSKA